MNTAAGRLAVTALCLVAALPLAARAAAPSSAPQVLLAITNSESMDGTTSGAIMVGSGSLGTSYSTLASSSSPSNYTIPSGFTPPLNAGTSTSPPYIAPYTAACSSTSSYLCDNGPSRLNMAKAAIKQVTNTYSSTLNFGIYDYSVSGVTLYTTWVYYMSPSGSGFTFTNTAGTSTVSNPCYGYSTASTQVKSDCTSIAAKLGSSTVSGNQYMTIGASSDAAAINDVLYWSNSTSAFLTYGTVTPANPYTYYSLNTYKTNLGGFSVSYSSTAPNLGGWSTTPTNAGYVPYSTQVMYAMRGFGYGGSQSATTGNVAVPMNTDPTGSTFTAALAPESNNASSSEIKASAGQSAIAGLMTGAKTYLGSLPKNSCQGQYVVLLTDGLPTLDLNGYAWPPLGTTTANAYNLTATFNTDGSLASTNSQAVQDAITAITNLYNAGIKTYVIGLGAGVNSTSNPIAAQVLQAMAVAGGTSSFFAATDTNSLNNAFGTIVYQIYSASAVAAPVAPISVSSGTAYEYSLTSVPSPMAGSVKAYAVNASGTASTTDTWDAATLMTAANRTTALRAANASGSIVTLANVDAAAFNLTATSCVPNVTTLINYTINPSYSYNGCSYLGGRQSGSFLDAFSTQDTGVYAGPPQNSTLIAKSSSYLSYARSNASRSPMLMFSNNDGFLYAVDASSGVIKWGWTSRNILAQLQNYPTFPSAGLANGNFAVVDAQDGGGNWGSYVVGSLQSGAEHFSFKLDSSGMPSTMVYDTYVSGGTAPGDKATATGAGPSRQPVQIAYVGGTAYAVYVVNTGSTTVTSTLYEVNVATGASTSAALGFQLSAALYLNKAGNQLWLGGADGSLRSGIVVTGNAATDVAGLAQMGKTVNPSTSATLSPVLYVGYGEVDGTPYAYALDASQLTVFGIGSSGWAPLWSVSNSAGYTCSSVNSSGSYNTCAAWTLNTGLAQLHTGSVVSDQPLIVGSSLLLPVYLAGSACTAGTGYYDFFSLATGAFPSNLSLTYNGSAVTGEIYLGANSGPAFTPSVTLVSGGVAFNIGATGAVNVGGGTSNTNVGSPTNPLLGNAAMGGKPYAWRLR